MDQSPAPRKQEIVAVLAVLLVIVFIVGAMIVTTKKHKPDMLASSKQTADASSSSPDTTSQSTTASSFKDGDYHATGSYDSPGGTESIDVTVSLKNGIVTATSATSGANDDDAQQYQSQFIDGYKALVIGKPITSIKLSRVSGSSLTSQGFNDAIAQIEQQAKA